MHAGATEEPEVRAPDVPSGSAPHIPALNVNLTLPDQQPDPQPDQQPDPPLQNDNEARPRRFNLASHVRQRYCTKAFLYSVLCSIAECTAVLVVPDVSARASLFMSLILSGAEIVSEIVVLALSWRQACGQLLGVWVLVRAFLQLLRIPLSSYFRLYARPLALNPDDPARARPPLVLPLGTYFRSARILMNHDDPARGSPSAMRFATAVMISGVFNLFSLACFFVGALISVQAHDEKCDVSTPLLYDLSGALFYIVWASFVVFWLPRLLCYPGLVLCMLTLRVARRRTEVLSRRAASDEAINALPTTVYAVGLMPEEDATCDVCWGEYEPGEVLRTLPCCHIYHRACIDRWLHINRVCPRCQRDIDAPIV